MSESSAKTPGVARRALVLIGLTVFGLAFLADWLGFGEPGSFGIGQVLVAAFGLVGVLAGWLGQRLIEMYRAAGVLLLNTLVLLAVLEVAAIGIARSGLLRTDRQEIHGSYSDIPYYQAQEWSDTYWAESLQAENYHYEPYIIWRHDPFSGITINIDEKGIRRTPEARCTPDAFRVFVFGGSTMWGWGAPDWATIAAVLQQEISARYDGPVCVVNFGEDGYVSTQSLVALILQLRAGNVPDAVIFYDGVNDVFTAFESGRPSAPVTLEEISARFEEREHPLITWARSWRQYGIYERLLLGAISESGAEFAAPSDPMTGENLKALAHRVGSSYGANIQLVSELALAYNFDYYFFWQPHLGLDPKPLTPEERALQQALDPELVRLAEAAYAEVDQLAAEQRGLWSLRDVFEQRTDQIWIDSWGHVTPEGNQLVAEAMTAVIRLPGPAR